MKEAMFYQKLKGEVVQCLLCPHNCIIIENSLGRCGIRQNVKGVLYSLNYGKITAAAYDPIEKKPLYNFHRGSNIFSLGSLGCNFTCDFCQNHEIVYNRHCYKEVDFKILVQRAGENNSIGMAYTYNEPTVWYEYVYDLARKIRDAGLLNVVVTNGFINKKPLEKILPLVDAMNIDLKSYSEDFYKKICGGKLEPVLNTIALAAKSTHIEVTTLLIDGENNRDIEEIAKFLAAIDENITLHISRYFPRYKRHTKSTEINSLFLAESVAKKYLNRVYLGNI